jgi:hypothetical protein
MNTVERRSALSAWLRPTALAAVNVPVAKPKLLPDERVAMDALAGEPWTAEVAEAYRELAVSVALDHPEHMPPGFAGVLGRDKHGLLAFLTALGPNMSARLEALIGLPDWVQAQLEMGFRAHGDERHAAMVRSVRKARPEPRSTAHGAIALGWDGSSKLRHAPLEARLDALQALTGVPGDQKAAVAYRRIAVSLALELPDWLPADAVSTMSRSGSLVAFYRDLGPSRETRLHALAIMPEALLEQLRDELEAFIDISAELGQVLEMIGPLQ